MKKIWIIGAGRFGRLAADRLAQKIKGLHLVMVDLNEEKLKAARGPQRILFQGDGALYLCKNLSRQNPCLPDWIVPAVPIHLASEWCLLNQRDAGLKRTRIPAGIEPLLPHPMRVADGGIFVSHADFVCPDDCAEPPHRCTHTGRPRKENMFALLEKVRFPPWQCVVIRSHQLGPGIGGYRPSELYDMARKIQKTRGLVLLSTACRCHGVITGLQNQWVSANDPREFLQKHLAI